MMYEWFPYPSRVVQSKSDLEGFGLWAANAMGKPRDWFLGKTVLELGCGTGEVAAGLGLFGARVIAVDLSFSSIEKGLGLKKKYGLDSVSFVQGDLFLFDPKEKFDVVLSLGVLHHTKNPRKGFGVAVSHVKAGGFVCVGLYNAVGRLRLRWKRWLVGLLAGSDVKKRMETAKKLFYGGRVPPKGEVYLADKFGQPYESYHLVEEVLHWFSEERLVVTHSRPALENHLSWMQIKWFLEKRGAFFVLTGKKN